MLRSSLPPTTTRVFLDASIPFSGNSRLNDLPSEAAAQFRTSCHGGFLGPLWTDDDLTNEIPDPVKRSRVVRQLTPMPVGIYEEPIPVPVGSLGGNHLFVLLTEHYPKSFLHAQKLGWTAVEQPTISSICSWKVELNSKISTSAWGRSPVYAFVGSRESVGGHPAHRPGHLLSPL